MLHHLSIGIAELQRSICFYDAAFEPLGYRRLWTTEDGAGYGDVGVDERFAIKLEAGAPELGSSPRSHLAIAARSRDAVVAFHKAAVRSGGKNLGEPGLRLNYGEDYFAAFVSDPDGYKIEAVCISKEAVK